MSWTEEEDYIYDPDEIYDEDYDEDYAWNDHQQSYGEYEEEFDDEDVGDIDREEYHEDSILKDISAVAEIGRTRNVSTLNRVFQLEGEREYHIFKMTIDSMSIPQNQKDQVIAKVDKYIEKDGSIADLSTLNINVFIYGALYSLFYVSNFTDVSEYLMKIIGIRGDLDILSYDTVRYAEFFNNMIV